MCTLRVSFLTPLTGENALETWFFSFPFSLFSFPFSLFSFQISIKMCVFVSSGLGIIMLLGT